MKKALFISHTPPFPAIGGDRLRIAQCLRLLSEEYDVDIAYLTKDSDGPEMKSFLSAIKGERRFYTPRLRRYLQAARTLFNSTSFTVNHFRNSRLLEYIKEVAGDYDLVFCASPVTAQYVLDCHVKRKVLDMTDSLSMNFSNAARNAMGLRKRLFEAEARRLANYERLCCRQFDAVAYISDVDSRWLGTDLSNHYIVGNAVVQTDSHHVSVDRAKALRHHIVFVGKMDYAPNVEAVVFFARHVLEKVQQKFADARFSIVGMSPSAEVKTLEQLAGVEVTGFVESISPWLSEASLVIAPMLSGSGVQNKILEALAHGCAVMTSPIGAEGIESIADVLEVIEPNAQAWAQAVTQYFDNPDTLLHKASLAPQRVNQEFGIDQIRKQFHDFVGH